MSSSRAPSPPPAMRAKPLPALTHQDPWAHPYICCDEDHSASTSTSTVSLGSAPGSHSHAPHCPHNHGPIGVGSRRGRYGADVSSSSFSTSITPTSSTLSSPLISQIGLSNPSPPQTSISSGSRPAHNVMGNHSLDIQLKQISLPPPATRPSDPSIKAVQADCHDPHCQQEVRQCSDPHCDEDLVPCSDPHCEDEVGPPCTDPHCEGAGECNSDDGSDACSDPKCRADTIDVCMDPQCGGDKAPNGQEDPHGSLKGCVHTRQRRVGADEGECCGAGITCLEEGHCQDCSMEELERWACSKEGTKIIQQYLECCSQIDCTLPIFSPPPNGNANLFPHTHSDGNVHHHLLSTLPSNNENIIPVPPNLNLSPWSIPLDGDNSLWAQQYNTTGPPSIPLVNPANVNPEPAVSGSSPAVVIPTHVCHWQNCHRVFDSMPDLLSHVASDHLGASDFANSALAVAPISSSSVQTSQKPNLSLSAGVGVDIGAVSTVTTAVPVSSESGPFALPSTSRRPSDIDAPSSGLPKPSTNPFSGDPTTELLSCLWDDCFPLSECTAAAPEACPTHAHMPAHPNVSHGSVPSHMAAHQLSSVSQPSSTFSTPGQVSTATLGSAGPTPHAHVEQPWSPQTMLRHVLEEHLGVPGSIIGWGSERDVQLGSLFGSTSVQNLATSHRQLHSHCHTPAPNQGHSHAQSHAHTHGHAHPAQWNHQHGSHYPSALHSHHSHDHHLTDCQPHSHSHHLPTPSTTHHTPSPPADGDKSQRHVNMSLFPKIESGPQMCLWPGCTLLHTFTSTAKLMNHLSDLHVGKGKDQYLCEWDGCNRMFRSRQKVLRHLQSHTGHRPFQCELCGQAFGEAAPLAAHMRRHAKERPFKCEYPGCDKTFAISSSLTIHMRTHNGEKPFICPHCHKGFVEASNLTKHIRTHTGERPFACAFPHCNKRFSRPDQLKRHMKVHDAEGPDDKVIKTVGKRVPVG
ncbi:hypothetical protein BD324DRAFT_652428 [Kockovaella imperatae]|uniref:C2H2-type domain-containing protein n=1 Tax=Kockovaella imperatae TaxID=4999 RepID=A0A1Y1UB75_9TREE|nr:hypothetical protein BD324DRAFT_652428 [Kockovaella imperatae]ORX35293.1 hypothetical protein BD324DRAFT_652428 [Kockovaella imperatae]